MTTYATAMAPVPRCPHPDEVERLTIGHDCRAEGRCARCCGKCRAEKRATYHLESRANAGIRWARSIVECSTLGEAKTLLDEVADSSSDWRIVDGDGKEITFAERSEAT